MPPLEAYQLGSLLPVLQASQEHAIHHILQSRVDLHWILSARKAETGPGKKIWMHWRNWWHLMQTVDYLTIIIVAFFFISNSKFSPLSLTCKRLEIFKRGSQQSPVHCPFFCFVHTNSASCIFVDGHCNNLLLEHANNLDWNRGLGLAKPTWG